MSLPLFVQAGSGVTVTTGTGTVSLAGATAGNIIVVHLLNDGTVYDRSNGTHTNLEALDGTASSHTTIFEAVEVGNPATATHSAYIGRATSGGTVSLGLVTGASGEDVFARIYEFTLVNRGKATASVIENGTSVAGQNFSTDTAAGDCPVTSNGRDRLAVNLLSINASQACVSFTGESPGDWTETVAEYIGTGTVGTIQLQTAELTSAATLDGGTFAITSAAWGSISFALIPEDLPQNLAIPTQMLGFL